MDVKPAGKSFGATPMLCTYANVIAPDASIDRQWPEHIGVERLSARGGMPCREGEA
jgi:hypothetical protein